MNIGLLKETKEDEFRVALAPEQVGKLVSEGHQVFFEYNCGLGAGFKDEQYLANKGKLASKQELFEKAELVLKVKVPTEEEINYLNEKHILFTYLHFDENISPESILKLAATCSTMIAYEWVKKNDDYPLLAPMSEITGAIFAKRSMELLTQTRGILVGDYINKVEPATAMVIGGGRIGLNAVKVFLMNGLQVKLVDKHPESVVTRMKKYMNNELLNLLKGNLEIILFDEELPENSINRIKELIVTADIVINAAVRRLSMPKEKVRYLITRQMVKSMNSGSILIDATACDDDLVETAISSSKLFETYIDENVIHYNCDHIPSLVANTATIALTHATFPYIRQLATNGFIAAIKKDEGFKNAVMTYKGYFVNEYVCQKKGLKYTDFNSLIE